MEVTHIYDVFTSTPDNTKLFEICHTCWRRACTLPMPFVAIVFQPRKMMYPMILFFSQPLCWIKLLREAWSASNVWQITIFHPSVKCSLYILFHCAKIMGKWHTITFLSFLLSLKKNFTACSIGVTLVVLLEAVVWMNK